MVREHKAFDSPYVEPDQNRLALEAQRLRRPPTGLDPDSRTIVAEVIAAHCRHRGWPLHAVNVRTNHVHVVVACGDVSSERVLGQLKAWSTRALREAARVAAEARVWIHHGSPRYLWTEENVRPAVTYVLEGQ